MVAFYNDNKVTSTMEIFCTNELDFFDDLWKTGLCRGMQQKTNVFKAIGEIRCKGEFFFFFQEGAVTNLEI